MFLETSNYFSKLITTKHALSQKFLVFIGLTQ